MDRIRQMEEFEKFLNLDYARHSLAVEEQKK